MTSSIANLSRFFMDKNELGAQVDRAPETLRRKMKKNPGSLPPFVEIGRKKLFFRELTSAWQNGELEKSDAKIKLNICGLPSMLGVAELAALLHFAKATIYTLKTDDESFLPAPGKYHQWDTRPLFDWIVAQVKGVKPEQIVLESRPPEVPTTAQLFEFMGVALASKSVGRGR